MIKTRYSEAYKRQLDERARERKEQEAQHKAALDSTRATCWARGAPWQPIENCPFAALADSYGVDGAIWVTDGTSVALASVSRRFGRPMRVIDPGELVLTDHGIMYEGGKLAEFDHPEWWFEWELTDAFGLMTYAGGEETGKEEIAFVPTHWMPSPPPAPGLSPTRSA